MGHVEVRVVRVEADNLLLHDEYMYENTVAVVPPGPAAPRGRVVTNLGQPRSAAGFVHRRLLLPDGAPDPVAATTKVGYGLGAEESNATDNQIVRLTDGTLLAVKHGYVWSDLDPPPEWFGQVSIALGGHTGLDQVRNALSVFASADGVTWQRRAVIDAAVVDGGTYGWPQPNSGDSQPHWVGGFDRSELYQNPWTGHVFITAHGDGGPWTKPDGTVVSNHDGLLMRSTDLGATWEIAYRGFTSAAPYAMTSTPTHPLVVFDNTSNGARIHLLDQNGGMDDGQLLVPTVDGSPVPTATDPTTGDVGSSPPAVARAGDDAVVIAYPALNEFGRQVYQVATVTLVAGGTHTVEAVGVAEAEDPSTTSCVLGALVEDTRATPSDDLAPPLLFWVEAKAEGRARHDELVVRGTFVTDELDEPFLLSVAGGQRRTFARGKGIGHYTKGTTVVVDDGLWYLAQWAEPDGIRGAVVFHDVIRMPRLFGHARTIDPLALVLVNRAYVLLTLPDPPPDEVLIEQVREAAGSLGRADRAALLARLGALRRFAAGAERAIEQARGR